MTDPTDPRSLKPSDDELLAPAHTAIVTVELQRAVCGDLATMPQLQEAAAQRGTIEAAAVVCRAARNAGARVVHCTAVSRPDGAGRLNNARILAATADAAHALVEGSPGAQVLPELEPCADDIELPRLHGLTPFIGTSLDRVLRNSGIETIVVVGNSLNIGVLGAVIAGVDLGYQVVVPSDAVIGVPVEYGDEILANTISLLATITTSAEIAAAWSR